MKPRSGVGSRDQKSKTIQGEGPNWVLIVGGALLSTLSIRLGYKMKQALDAKQPEDAVMKGTRKYVDNRRLGTCHTHPSAYSFVPDEDSCLNCIPAEEMDIQRSSGGQILTETDMTLPLVTVAQPAYNVDNDMVWSSSSDRLELPPKPYHQSNCSDSPCVSESGSDIFSKREVVQKLRQQLKRRDDMILEMQDQIAELQNALDAQLSHSTHMQSELANANRELFDSQREIQRLRKAIADHCVTHLEPNETLSVMSTRAPDGRNGHANGYLDGESHFGLPEKGRADGERIEMLKKEIEELKEVIDGKEYLLQSYKEQKTELSFKIKELQQRLDYQLPNIL